MPRTLIAAAVGIPLLALSLASPVSAVLPQATLTAVATIPVGERPSTPVLDEATGQLYVANSESASISVIGTSSNAVVATIDIGTPGDDEIEDLALDSARGRLFALIPYTNTLLVIGTGTNTILKTITLKGDPTAMVLDGPRGRLYVLTKHPTALVTVASPSGAVVRTAAAPTGATILSLNPANGRLYTDEWRSNRGSILAVDPRNSRAVWRIAGIDDAVAMVPDAARSLLYVPLHDDEDPGTLLVLDTRSRKVVTGITVGMWPGLPVLDTLRNHLYLASANSRSIAVIDTVTNTVIGRIATGGNPATPVLDAAAARLFISTYARSGGSVLMVDPATNGILATAFVGDSPSSPVINSSATRVYVANRYDGTVSVIAAS
ncbi:MAG: YncE family protein [Actinomycetota bacterium]|nr:YncE family protein [Actinomycetota bacterium]